MNKSLKVLILLFFFLPPVLFSQENNESDTKKINLIGKHSICVNLGFISQTSAVTIDPLNVSNKTNFQASLSYNYWVLNEFAFEGSIGFINSSVNNDVSIFGIEQKTAVVTNYYFGAKYSPVFKSIPSSLRPFTRLLAGAVIGSATEEKISGGLLKSNSTTQTVLSVKLGIGADAILDKYLRFGLAVDYLYMPDFSESVGTRKNYSGFNFSFILGAIF